MIFSFHDFKEGRHSALKHLFIKRKKSSGPPDQRAASSDVSQ
jgi:hypothetical protein